MRGRSHVFVTRAARAVRRLRPDRNPLMRTLDRVEAAVGAGLAIAFLAGAPLAAIEAGHFASSIGSRAGRSQQAALHHVPAVVLAPVPASGASPTGRPRGGRPIGHIPVPPGARAGATVTVWVDVSGQVTGPPLELRRGRDQAALAPMLAFIAVGVIVLCTGRLAFGALDRRRLAVWEADWRATEPQWTGRH